MQVFSFYSASDFNSGVFNNTRADDLYNTSVYDKDAIIPDGKLSSSVSTYGNVLFSTSTYYPQDWQLDQPNNQGISTYNAATYVDFQVQASKVEIICLTSPQGAIVRPFVDLVELESFSTYGNIGQSVTYSVPLNVNVPQHLRIMNSGYADKNSSHWQGPTNVVGSSMAPAITYRQNGTRSITDTWTFLGVSATTCSVTQASTGATFTLTYNTLYSLINVSPSAPVIPGFDIQVLSGVAVGDSATVITHAPLLSISSYVSYPEAANSSSWQTPILDAVDPNTVWAFSRHETAEYSTSSYSTYVQVGDVLPVDSSWVQIVPTTAAFVDNDPTVTEVGTRDVTSDLGRLKGRYALVTYSINASDGLIRYPRIYTYNAQFDPVLNLMGPIITGPNTNKLISSLEAAIANLNATAERMIHSLAVSTAEREYLIAIGNSLGFPKARGESFDLYRARLAILYNSNNSGSNVTFMTNAIQAYLESSTPYIVSPQTTSPPQWNLGSAINSILGSSTFLGGRGAIFWQYEIHIPAATCPNLIVSNFEAFVRLLNPIGAIPIFVYE